MGYGRRGVDISIDCILLVGEIFLLLIQGEYRE